MSKQPRVVKVLAALLVSMTVGAFVLMALGNNPPSAGPFCLSAYYRLDSVDHVVQSKACQVPHRWNIIEIYFSGTKRGSLQQAPWISQPQQTRHRHIGINDQPHRSPFARRARPSLPRRFPPR